MSRKADSQREIHVPPGPPNLHPLRKLRKAVGLTTTELGGIVGLDDGYISKLENGLNRPSPETAEKIASAFRGAITEMHLFYPWRYNDWFPTPEEVESLMDLKHSARESDSTTVSA